MIKVMRLRRTADEWGQYKTPIQERRYVPFKGKREPAKLSEIHERVASCYRAVDFQVWDRNYVRWVRGDDVPHLGERPEKKFPSLSRIYSSQFHSARVAEGLNSQRETVEFLLAEYERWPPIPGGYSGLRIEYPVHLEALASQVRAGRRTVSQFMHAGFPNTFLERKGVSSATALRREWGAYAAHKLAPLDQQYVDELANLLRERGRVLGTEREARSVARTLKPYLLSECTRPELAQTLAGAYENALAQKGLRMNGEAHMLAELDAVTSPSPR